MATYTGIKKIKIGDNIFELAIDWSKVTNQPTIPSAVTESTVSGWGFTKNAGTLTGVTFAGTAMSVSSGVASITQANARTALGLATVATSGSYNDLSNKPTIPTNTDEKVKLTSNTGTTAVPLVLGPTSITSGTAYNCLYNTNLKYTPSTGNLQTTQLNGVTVGSSPKFTDSEVSTLTLASGSTAGTSLSFGSKYTLTAGSKTVSFTMPSSPTVPTITLNGSTTTSPSFYAPTTAGTSGYILKSNGSGAPSWTNSKTDILDMFYPVGTIYETLDSTFDPNVSWGGTWEQIQDKFLLAAGSTYHIGDSDGGNSSASYTPQGTIGGTKLSDAQIAHGHTFTQPTISGGSHSHDGYSDHQFITVDATDAAVGKSKVTSGSSTTRTYIYSDSAVYRNATTASATPSMTASGGAVGNLSGASSTRTTHNHTFTGTASTINTMPPYTIVNVWKRTA